ncbi:MAG: ABC transporter ATP-binding protein [Candidatus Electrothrix sp. Rat3]|nr:ABC transporter ATP-binding protein [Candidatus Electrothrix rattekaaiensis]
MSSVIKIENLWKEYRLGVIGHGTLREDLQSWWAEKRGKEDPNAGVSTIQSGSQKQIVADHFWALQNINVEVDQGEILGIIGKNGAGKSTLLKILSRITAPTKGNIKIKGRIASLLEVGTGFHGELTGRENIFLNGAILGMSKGEIHAKLDEIIDFAGIEAFVDTPVKRYSSGMFVRLAFAVAAHLEPEILIIDEVLAVGDADFQKKCLSKLKGIKEEGKTILFVSHQLHMVQSICSKVLLLNNGEVVTQGSTDRVIGLYRGGGTAVNEGSIEYHDELIGDDIVRLLAVSVLDSNNSTTVRPMINQAIKILVEIEVLRHSERQLVPRLDVKMEDGKFVFISFAVNEIKPLKIGKHSLLCHIPSNFLNQNNYYISIGLVSYKPTRIMHFHEHDVLSFDVVDPLEGVPTRPEGIAMNEFPGAVRPLLEWEIMSA